MYVEWAVGCGTAIETGSRRWEVIDFGRNGYDLTGEPLPCDVEITVIVGFRHESGDEEGGFYDFGVEVVAPEAPRPAIPFRVAIEQDTSPTLLSVERSCLATPIRFTVVSPGEYRLRFFDAMGERYVLPYRFMSLPEL